jgi:hypothetical protein
VSGLPSQEASGTLSARCPLKKRPARYRHASLPSQEASGTLSARYPALSRSVRHAIGRNERYKEVQSPFGRYNQVNIMSLVRYWPLRCLSGYNILKPRRCATFAAKLCHESLGEKPKILFETFRPVGSFLKKTLRWSPTGLEQCPGNHSFGNHGLIHREFILTHHR